MPDYMEKALSAHKEAIETQRLREAEADKKIMAKLREFIWRLFDDEDMKIVTAISEGDYVTVVDGQTFRAVTGPNSRTYPLPRISAVQMWGKCPACQEGAWSSYIQDLESVGKHLGDFTPLGHQCPTKKVIAPEGYGEQLIQEQIAEALERIASALEYAYPVE